MKAKQERRRADRKTGKQAGKPAEKKKAEPPPIGGLGGPDGHVRWVSFDRRRKAVKLYLEEGIPSGLVAKEIGVTSGTVFDWGQRGQTIYKDSGDRLYII